MTTTKTSTYSSVFATAGPTMAAVPENVGSRQESPCSFAYDTATAVRRSFPAYDPTPNEGVGCANNANGTCTPPTALQQQQQDSDCGSSSGLGGMTKHEGSSDTSSLESDARDSGGGGGENSLPAPSVVSAGTLPSAPPLVNGTNPNFFVTPPPRLWPGSSMHPPPPTLAPPVHSRPFYTTTAPAMYHSAAVAGNSTAASVMCSGRNQSASIAGGENATSAGSNATGSAITPGTSAGSTRHVTSIATSSVPPGVPPVTTNASLISGSDDVFVHVQEGETISIVVGNEVQQIAGPATIRMIGLFRQPVSALPLHVPRGHVIQQIVDEQGYLRHLILSPESSTAASSRVSTTGSIPGPLANGQLRSGATTPHKHGTSPKSISPPVVPPYPPPGLLHTTDFNDAGPSHVTPRKWSTPTTKISTVSDGKRSSHGTLSAHGVDGNAVCNGTIAENEQTSCGIEEDERERLKDTLNGIQCPQIVRVTSRECELTWQELDTSEAAASGGPFPQIDASEFTYEIFMYEGAPDGRLVTQHRCEPSPLLNGLRLTRLRPNTAYFVNIRASLPERELYGSPSRHVQFHTLAGRPDAPDVPRIANRGVSWVIVSWRPPNSNGSPIKMYFLQLAKGKSDTFKTVYEGIGENAKVGDLEVATHYRIRVIARNDCGSSDPSAPLRLYLTAAPTTSLTSSVPAPLASLANPPNAQKASPPTLLSVSARSVRLMWSVLPEYASVTLEVCDSVRSNPNAYTPVSPECYGAAGNTASVGGLQSNREYRFRLAGTTVGGESFRSEYLSVKTHKDRYENSTFHQNLQQQPQAHDREKLSAPTDLHRVHDGEEPVEIAWRYSGRDLEGVCFIVEGTTLSAAVNTTSNAVENGTESDSIEQPWRVCYRGINNSASISDPFLCLFRVKALNKKNISSAWSDTLYVKRQAAKKKTPTPTSEALLKPSVCTMPHFANITWCSMDVSWTIQNDEQNGSSDQKEIKTPALLFELQRVDKQPIIIYSGDKTEYHLDSLKPVEHVQVRARAVIVDYEGKRTEGDWSSIGSACTIIHAPSAPQELRLITSTETKLLSWSAPAQLNGSAVVEYIVYSSRSAHSDSSVGKEVTSDERYGSTTVTEFPLRKLCPAQTYRFQVVAINEGGPSDKSEPVEYKSPPSVPDTPETLSVEPISTTEINVTWSAPNDNGSPLTGYRISTHETFENGNKQLVYRQIANAEATTATVSGLKMETDYEIEIQAENAIGRSDKTSRTCQTLPPPPEPPILCLALASANVLKLKWANAPSSSRTEPTYYYLEKENDNGTFSPVYEGETKTAKVKGLKEYSAHRFRIRAALARLTIAGPWSSTYTFYTTRSPPPTIRSPPTITEISAGAFQIEWQPVRATSNGEEQIIVHQQFYRLQVAPKLGREKTVETWKTVYEGAATSYTLTVPAIAVLRQARVFVVQVRDGEEEAVSQASPVALFSTVPTPKDSPRKRPKHNGSIVASSGSSTPNSTTTRSSSQLPRGHKMSLYRRFKRFLVWLKKTISEKDCALIVLAVFVLFAISIAVVLNNYYDF